MIVNKQGIYRIGNYRRGKHQSFLKKEYADFLSGFIVEHQQYIGKLKDCGITKGFIIQRVNDNMIKSIDDLQNVVKEASTSKDPVLYVQGIYPTGKKAYFAIPLDEN